MKCQNRETVHEGQQPNLLDNWADTSLHLQLAVALPDLSLTSSFPSASQMWQRVRRGPLGVLSTNSLVWLPTIVMIGSGWLTSRASVSKKACVTPHGRSQRGNGKALFLTCFKMLKIDKILPTWFKSKKLKNTFFLNHFDV